MTPDRTATPAHWGLLDAEAQHEAFPDAFPIPTRQERDALQPGDLVKLVFVLDPPPASGPNAERMWVEVRSVDEGAYDGWLTNAPTVIDHLDAGTFLTFSAEHVAGIALRKEEVAFAPETRAVVSRRALSRSGPPGWVGHDDPVDVIDSGWTIAAGDEPADHFSGDPAETTLGVTLGELVQRYPSLVEVFQAGDGEWVYRPDHRRYVRLKPSVTDPSLAEEQPVTEPPTDRSAAPPRSPSPPGPAPGATGPS